MDKLRPQSKPNDYIIDIYHIVKPVSPVAGSMVNNSIKAFKSFRRGTANPHLDMEAAISVAGNFVDQFWQYEKAGFKKAPHYLEEARQLESELKEMSR